MQPTIRKGSTVIGLLCFTTILLMLPKSWNNIHSDALVILERIVSLYTNTKLDQNVHLPGHQLNVNTRPINTGEFRLWINDKKIHLISLQEFSDKLCSLCRIICALCQTDLTMLEKECSFNRNLYRLAMRKGERNNFFYWMPVYYFIRFLRGLISLWGQQFTFSK